MKYRIYDTEDKCYVEEPDFRWLLSRDGKLYNSENDEWHNIGEKYLVEFFTGLTDKNGKEIYEGDILQKENVYGKLVAKVYFANGSFMYNQTYCDEKNRWLRTNNQSFNLNFMLRELEVIGNIHDNPELLTEK